MLSKNASRSKQARDRRYEINNNLRINAVISIYNQYNRNSIFIDWSASTESSWVVRVEDPSAPNGRFVRRFLSVNEMEDVLRAKIRSGRGF